VIPEGITGKMNQHFPEKTGPTTGNAEQLQRLTSGSVLVAREVLQDPNFDATLVLICAHNPDEGSYGLVLNRVSHMPVSEIFDGCAQLQLSREILIGGPVQQEELQVVQVTDAPADGAYPISEGVYMGGRWTDLNKMIESDPQNTHLFLGYSGWGPSQLESEIQLGAWDVYNVDLKKLLYHCHMLTGADTSAITSFLQTISLQ
jgi:putative transcriptional regulator